MSLTQARSSTSHHRLGALTLTRAVHGLQALSRHNLPPQRPRSSPPGAHWDQKEREDRVSSGCSRQSPGQHLGVSHAQTSWRHVKFFSNQTDQVRKKSPRNPYTGFHGRFKKVPKTSCTFVDLVCVWGRGRGGSGVTINRKHLK